MNGNPVVRTVYELLRFFATWLQQPTMIQVAESVEVEGSGGHHSVAMRSRRRTE